MSAAEVTSAQLRVLAHPIRLAFLRRLRSQGAATARALGREFELDSGAASYHLRRLAKGGLIEEDVNRGTLRERWWRAIPDTVQFDPSQHREDDQVSREYVRSVALADAEQLQRVAAAVSSVPPEWIDEAFFFDRALHLGPAELASLKRELHDIVDRYATEATGTGENTSAVQVQFQVYSQP